MYNFTVIIPHKDTPEMLERAINSVPQREDLQLIVVDDNSDPKVVDFCNFPGRDRPNTEIVLTKEGRGAGYARNIGLKYAKGEWVIFLDADDEFTDGINNILDTCDNDCDIVYFATIEKDSATGEVYERFTEEVFKVADAQKLRYRIFAPWSKIFKLKNLIENRIEFEEIPYSNDMMFSVKADYILSKSSYNPTIGLTHYSGHNSLTHTITANSLICRMKCNLRVYDYAKLHEIQYTQSVTKEQFLWYACQLKPISKFYYYFYITKYNLKTSSTKSLLSNIFCKLVGRHPEFNV